MEGIGTVAAIGGILLAVVLLWATLRNRQRRPAEIARTEAATRALHEQIDREDKLSDPDPSRY